MAPRASRAAAPNKTLGPARVAHSASFLTGAGGFLQQFIYRYTGLRLTENGVAPKCKPIYLKRSFATASAPLSATMPALVIITGHDPIIAP